MAQALPRYCPRCGTPTWVGMQFCATCELPASAMLSRPDNRPATTNDFNDPSQQAMAAIPRQTQQGNEAYFAPISPQNRDFQADLDTVEEPAIPSQFPPISPLPPAAGNLHDPRSQDGQQMWSAPAQQPAPDNWNAANPSYPSNNPAAAGWNAAEPAYPAVNQAAQPAWGGQSGSPGLPTQQKTPRQGRRMGRILILIVLLVLLLLAGGGYFAFSAAGGHLPGSNASQASIKTTSLNSSVTYAGVAITVLNVQQSQNFVDDPQSASNGMVRLNLQEQNPTGVTIAWDYNQIARLGGAGQTALVPIYVKSKGSIAPGVTQKSVIDFVVANGGTLNKLVFQLGSSKEAQILIPLNGQANLSQYQAKTTTQNGKLTYFGLNWTLTGATTSWSIPKQQASNGTVFLTLNLTVDNTLSQEAISGSPFDYMRIKVGNQTIAPVSTTVPISFASGDMGKKGTTTFLIPQNSTTCTLLMVSQDPGTSGQASLDFQIG
ncbi:MAG TPA: hypothetical protein VGD98_20425 [Ktedonobacteraceae bacterium]